MKYTDSKFSINIEVRNEKVMQNIKRRESKFA